MLVAKLYPPPLVDVAMSVSDHADIGIFFKKERERRERAVLFINTTVSCDFTHAIV